MLLFTVQTFLAVISGSLAIGRGGGSTSGLSLFDVAEFALGLLLEMPFTVTENVEVELKRARARCEVVSRMLLLLSGFVGVIACLAPPPIVNFIKTNYISVIKV